MNEPYQGSRRVTSIAYHKAGAPWPTCACVHCRRARAREVDGDALAGHVERIRSRIYHELRRPGVEGGR